MPSDKHFEDVIYPSESDLNSSKDESLDNIKYTVILQKIFQIWKTFDFLVKNQSSLIFIDLYLLFYCKLLFLFLLILFAFSSFISNSL